MLPGMVLGLFTVGPMFRFTRASVLEVINNDYVRAARAKGLSEWTVIRRHVMRPALLPIATVAGLAFGSLLSGTVLVESIFSWPGIGEYAYHQRHQPRPPGDHGREHRRRHRLHRDQPSGGPALQHPRPEDRAPVSTTSALPLDAGPLSA